MSCAQLITRAPLRGSPFSARGEVSGFGVNSEFALSAFLTPFGFLRFNYFNSSCASSLFPYSVFASSSSSLFFLRFLRVYHATLREVSGINMFLISLFF